MKNWKKRRNRSLALFLAVMLCFGTSQQYVFAAGLPEEISEEVPDVEKPQKDSEDLEGEMGVTGETEKTDSEIDEPQASTDTEQSEESIAKKNDLENTVKTVALEETQDLSPEQTGIIYVDASAATEGEETVSVEEESVTLAEEQSATVSPKGTKENPYCSLSEAIEAADKLIRKDVTIEILSNLTATECARINGKDITIKGNGYTITRGDNFGTIADVARSWYNPAMIEVCNSAGSATASLRLENITLDDQELTAGTKFSQASTDGMGDNTAIVQDAIIATYDGVGTITLGNNVTLAGYGGMSAVRLSGGTLIMESGSKITGGKNFTTKGGGNGAAGAVWIQGGSFTMNEGAEINGVMGRGIYLDGSGSKATVNGTITGIKPNTNMWQGTDGTAMHVRNESKAVLGATGKVVNIEGGACAISIINSSFEAQNGSEISNLKNTRVANANGAKEEDKNPHLVFFDGTVKDCTYNDVQFWAWYARYVIGSNAVIENTTAKSKAIGMFYLQNGGEMKISGKIQNNNNTVVYMGNQGGTTTVVRVMDGACIHNNQGYGVYANNGGNVYMEGGEISENTSHGLYVRAKPRWKEPMLEMSGGKIINNKSYGVYYTTAGGSKCHVNITGGEISGNGSSYSPYQVYISGANAKDNTDRVYIKTGIVKAGNGKEDIINTSFGQLKNISLSEGQTELYLGNAISASSNKIEELVTSYKVNTEDINTYTAKGSALWFKTPGDTLEFKTSRSYLVNKALPLYAVYIPLKADGTPVDNPELTVLKVDNTEVVDISLAGLTPSQSYALMWMQPTEKFGTWKIDDTEAVNEVLGQSSYSVDYKATYTLTKDIAGLVEPGVTTFTATIQLDPVLGYQADSVELLDQKGLENTVFELVNTEVNASGNIVITMKTKEGFEAEKNKNYPVVIAFRTDANIPNANFESGTLNTTGYLKGSVVLSGDVKATDFILETPTSAKTVLNALPVHTVSYTGGSVNVKEGTALALNLAGGTGTTAPTTVTEDITLDDPTWEGYTFTGWTVVNGMTEEGIPSITFIAAWRSNETSEPDNPTIPDTPDGNAPTTPNTPNGNGTITPTAPAALAMSPTVIPAAPVPVVPVPEEQPVEAVGVEAELEAEQETVQQIEEPVVPLASGNVGSWALLNLLLMLFTTFTGIVLTISAARKTENENRKRALRISSLIPAVVAVAVFVLTENMRAPMEFVNGRTVWMLLFAVVQLVIIVLSRKSEEEMQNEEL